MPERTLIIVKPDGVQRHLIGEIITRFERKGLKLVAARFMHIREELACNLYDVHKEKDFYEKLVKNLASSPVLVMVWEAEGVIKMARKMLGSTSGFDAEPGSIRGDYSCSARGFNLVHGSDSPESAEREISLFFQPEEICDYDLSNIVWLCGRND